ncbi:unnamed protein product [Pylaiella littoralis]
MPELRQRPAAASVRSNPATEPTAAPDPMPPAKKTGGCPVQLTGKYYYIRKAVVILFPAYILCCMFEVLEPPRPLMEHAWDAVIEALGKGPRIFSAAELEAKGVGPRPMLSILGEVFDVSKGKKHYAKGGAYEGFTGKDATRAFVSGDFTEGGLTDDVSGLKPSQCLGIKDWHSFYIKEDKYRKRGILAGRFYDAKGNPTRELAEFDKCVRKGRQEKEREAAEKKLYPSCNSRWAAAEGGRVWCEDPKKVPRKFPPKDVHGADIRTQGSPEEVPGKQPSEARGDEDGEAETSRDAAKMKGRCSCFDVDYARANEDRLLSYGGCASDSNSCVTKPPEAPKPKRK